MLDVDWVDVRLAELHYELLKPIVRPPLSMRRMRVEPQLLTGDRFPPDGRFALKVRYRLDGVDRAEHPNEPEETFLRVDLTYVVVGVMSKPVAFIDDDVTDVLRLLHDYLRQELHACTQMMNVPPLVLDVYRPSPQGQPA